MMRKQGRGPPAKRQRTPHDPVPVAAFIFRRDFRLNDNIGLLKLLKSSASRSLVVLPLFFFNPVQCDPEKNLYFGNACFEFLCQSLRHLGGVQLGGRLVCLRGSDVECLEAVRSAGYDIKQLGFNCDITPFARRRDVRLEEWCISNGIQCVTTNRDYTLFPPEMIINGNREPYRVFTPFYNRVLRNYFDEILAPDLTAMNVETGFTGTSVRDDIRDALEQRWKAVNAAGEVVGLGVEYVDLSAMPSFFVDLADVGGREAGLSCLERVTQAMNYSSDRDDIPGDKTTHLSPHLKFGTVSIREAMQMAVLHLGKEHAFTRQLIWREFYAMLLYHNPRVVLGQLKYDRATAKGRPDVSLINEPFLEKYSKFQWKWDDSEFTAFKLGRTGFPLVDAAVRCITRTGWCHNRCRMIIANFLVKVLFVDWREGERWYATVAVDYDVANNSGGWLWSSGQGADAQPYFRIFNPFRQSARYDPQAVFIKRWVPELQGVPAKVIHEWDVYCRNKRGTCQGELDVIGTAKGVFSDVKNDMKQSLTHSEAVDTSAYPCPIVDLKQRAKWIVENYKRYNEK
uniref:Putative deoxyribodipyrimidine photolyase n=1 Tax=Trypanosoma congolense (strain IL3000) TaxID=1068625 RepID=G0UXN7_TRYCI|nr:putative deoxyribodipyrimidine photolyase [Trypanosoma congolense IL3000]